MSLNFFYGDEEYLLEQEIKKLKEKFLDKEFLSMNYKYVKNPSFPDLISLLSTQPMMFGNQIIVIDVENLFDMSLDDFQVTELQGAMENISPSLYVILRLVFERNSKGKPDARKKVYKMILKYAQVKEFASISIFKTDDLISFINKEAKKQGIVIERTAGEKLIEQVGNNLREIVREIEKLALFVYPKNKVTEQIVKDNCIVNQDIFALTDKLFNGKKASAVYEFRKLCDKQYPLAVLSTVQTSLRKTLIMKLNEKKLPISEIAKMVGFTEYVVQKRLQELKNVNLKELVRLKKKLAEVEFRIKSGKALDIGSEIEMAFY